MLSCRKSTWKPPTPTRNWFNSLIRPFPWFVAHEKCLHSMQPYPMNVVWWARCAHVVESTKPSCNLQIACQRISCKGKSRHSNRRIGPSTSQPIPLATPGNLHTISLAISNSRFGPNSRLLGHASQSQSWQSCAKEKQVKTCMELSKIADIRLQTKLFSLPLHPF